MAEPRKKLPLVEGATPSTGATGGGKAARARAGGWAAFTENGTSPGWLVAARVVMLVALAATIPTILGVSHGNRLLWTVAIAALPFFWMTVGYHVWRRICPLAVVGQLGRLVGRPGTRKMSDFMARNYVLVQLGFMIAALSLRLTVTNGSDIGLAIFLGAVVVAAAIVSFVYAGKSWCNFICPVGLVEKIYTEPARSSSGAAGEMTSQCTPCVACKKHCPDIDLEQGYWKEANDRGRRIAYFAWPGVVVAFYVYYYLASGSWSYYFSGEWAYERELQVLTPGFTFAPQLARAVAAPLTLIVFGAVSYAVFSAVEAVVRRLRRPPIDAPVDQIMLHATRIRHGMLAFAGLVAFNAFYCFAGQPSLQRLPGWVVTGWGLIVVFSSTAIFMRRSGRREDQYVQEKFAQKILKKWEWGDAPPSDDLKDIYLLHTERTKQREARLRAYKETIREMVADGLVTRNELVILDSLRAQLGVSDKDHLKIVGELGAEERQLFDPAYQGSVEQRLARQQYRKDLERIVVEAARQGAAPAPATLTALRTERGVSEADEAAQLAEIVAPDGPIAVLYHHELAEIGRLCDAIASPGPAGARSTPAGSAQSIECSYAPADARGTSESASLSLLRHLAERRAHEHVAHALGVLAVMTKRKDIESVHEHAKSRGRLDDRWLEPLNGVDPALRAPLVELVTRMRQEVANVLRPEPLLAISEDRSRHLRAAVAMLLSRFDDDATRAALLGMLDDPEAIVRESSVRALGAKSRLTRDLLAKVLDDPSPLVRSTAVRAVSGPTSAEHPAIDVAALAQTTKGVGQVGVYATLDANAAMASLTTVEKMMLIRQVPMFSELDADDLEELASIVEERIINPNKDLFLEGDAGDAVYLIVKGHVRVYLGGGDRPETTLNELGPGACIGEMAVLDQEPRSASVRALERTRTLRVPGDGFKRLMSQRPEMSEAIVTDLVARMRRLNAQLSKK